MKVLVAAFAYNERPYIPYMVDYYRKQGCELLILDNYSTDGTYEWLIENKIRTARVDTRETFLLHRLNSELTKKVKAIKPDWVVYCGIDIYYYFEGTIIEEIQKAEDAKCNVIEVYHFTAYNTGEQFKLPFPKNYFYMQNGRKLQMIAKFDNSYFKFVADGIHTVRGKTYYSNGALVNYGQCKPKEEREETYLRRQKAWEIGEHVGHGTHYKPAHDRNWIWSKEELKDIRTTIFRNLIKC